MPRTRPAYSWTCPFLSPGHPQPFPALASGSGQPARYSETPFPPRELVDGRRRGHNQAPPPLLKDPRPSPFPASSQAPPSHSHWRGCQDHVHQAGKKKKNWWRLRPYMSIGLWCLRSLSLWTPRTGMGAHPGTGRDRARSLRFCDAFGPATVSPFRCCSPLQGAYLTELLRPRSLSGGSQGSHSSYPLLVEKDTEAGRVFFFFFPQVTCPALRTQGPLFLSVTEIADANGIQE